MKKSEFELWLDQLCSDIWEAADDVWCYSLPELAKEAGLCNSTVYNLWHGKTREPRLHTIYKLAAAVGMDMELVEESRPKSKRRAA